MKKFKFSARLQRPKGVGTWHYIDTPIDTEKEFEIKGKVPICGQVNNTDFTSSLIPRGNGEHYIVMGKNVRDQAEITIGDVVQVEIWRDLNERKVEIPTDLKSAINTDSEINNYFSNLAYSHQKAYVEWIIGAKKESTRQKRILKAMEMLGSKQKLK